MRSIRSMGAVVAFAALLGACGDATGPVQNAVGTVRFTYSGARSGTFEAVGRFPAATSRGTPSGTWAAAVRLRGRPVPDDNEAVLTANQRRDDARFDDFSVLFVPLEVGTLSCGEDDAVPLCPIFAQLRFGVPVAGDPEAEFVVEAGTLRVTEASESRIAGTFELVLREVESGVVLLVSDGTFDVPVVEVRFGVVDRIP